MTPADSKEGDKEKIREVRIWEAAIAMISDPNMTAKGSVEQAVQMVDIFEKSIAARLERSAKHDG